MSMDLVLYTACAIAFPTDLPEAPDWIDNREFGWTYDGGTWLVRAAVESEKDIPKEASELVPDLDHAISLMVEGSGEDATDFLGSVVSTVVGQCGRGVVESPTGFDKIEI